MIVYESLSKLENENSIYFTMTLIFSRLTLHIAERDHSSWATELRLYNVQVENKGGILSTIISIPQYIGGCRAS